MTNQIIKDQLSKLVKLIRKDSEINCLQNSDAYIAMEISVLFLKLADQVPASALALIDSEIEATEKMIKLSRVMASM